MVNKIAVIYKSKYGKTKRYAEWIAEALNAPLFEHTKLSPRQLNNYDVVIYGGGLYAGGINGIKLVKGNFCKSLIVFTVGVADPKDSDYTHILENAFTTEKLSKIKTFHLRGGIDYIKLSPIHRLMMAAMKKLIEKKPIAKRDSDDVGILETYGKNVDFCDKATIKPLVEYVRTL
ncbi:MAG: flavodoxin domain-containing protein [Defluviitaleaceae bacterium]|nr:flavodoxin domain-containing protein [Defluviitaleaceae bacterium]